MRFAISILLFACFTLAGSRAGAQEQSPTAPAQKSAAKTAKSPENDKAAPPATDTSQAPKKSTAEENPFPEEQSKDAAKQVEEGKAPPLPADLGGDGTPAPRPDSPDSAQGTDGVSSSRTRLEGLDENDPDAKRTEQPKVSEPVHNSQMSAKDVSIAKMYFQNENYRGAYIRYKEALSLDPENADAAFGVAESSRRLNQTQEAIDNYQLCLKIDPDGPRAKAARKALNSLSAAASH